MPWAVIFWTMHFRVTTPVYLPTDKPVCIRVGISLGLLLFLRQFRAFKSSILKTWGDRNDAAVNRTSRV